MPTNPIQRRLKLVTRLLAVMFITLALFALATYEAVAVSDINNQLEADVSVLYEDFENDPENISSFTETVSDLKKQWDSEEDALCLMFNHKDLSCITDTFTRLLASVKNNDYDSAIIEVNLLKEYSEKNRHVMGFNLQNIL